MRVTRPIRNPWPFTRRAAATKPSKGARGGAGTCGRRSTATVSDATKAAYKAGHNKGDTGLFDSWVCERGLQDRGTPVLKRLRAEFERGVEDAIRGVALAPSSVRGGPVPVSVPSTPRATAPTASETYKGYKIRQDANGDWYSSLDSDSTFETKAAVKSHIDNWRSNPRNPLPPRTLDTMSEAIALSSPSGRMSARAREAADKRFSTALFGPGGLERPRAATQSHDEKRARLLDRAKEMRLFAARGFKPRVHLKEAERLEAEAAAMESNPRRGLRHQMSGALGAYDDVSGAVWKYTGGLPSTIAHGFLDSKNPGGHMAKRRYGVEPRSIGGGYVAFWREGDEWKYSRDYRSPDEAKNFVESQVIPNRWSGAKLSLPWKAGKQWEHYHVDVTMPKQSNPYVEGTDETLEIIPSEIPVFQGSREELPGVVPFVEYTTLQEAMAYAQAVKGIQPGVCVVGFGEDVFGVVLDADTVREAEAGTVGERVVDAEFEAEIEERANPDQSKRSVATDTAEREGMERGVTDARYLKPMKTEAEALSFASAYVRQFLAEHPHVGEFYYDGYTHGYTSAARDVAAFTMGPYDKKGAAQQAGDLKRQGYEEIAIAKEKSPYGGFMYSVSALTRDARKHPVPGRAKRNPAGADDAAYAAELRRRLQTASGPDEKYLRALLKFYDYNGRLPSMADERADALQRNPARRGVMGTHTKTLTLRKELYFGPERGNQVGVSLRAGEKVKVTWSPGIEYATAYYNRFGTMLSHATEGKDGPEEYKNWPKEWVSTRSEENPRRNPDSGVEDSQYAADAMYEDFHGRASGECLEVETEIFEPDHLAVLGTLVSIVVATVSGLEAELGFESDPPYLCSSPDGTQLYIQGGNQTLDLEGLKMDGPDWERQHMVIGEMVETTYRTEKSFDKFATIDYYHANGEESGVPPQLLYDPVNGLLSVAGGRYKVLPEGIVD